MLDRLYRMLSRESSSGRFIPEIDGLRFVAIMSVVLFHLNQFVLRHRGLDGPADALSQFLDKGFLGVPLFFVISGFIISQPFAERLLKGQPGVPLRSYLTRRLTRLEPPYVLNLLLAFMLLAAARKVFWNKLAWHLLASVFYVHNVTFGEASLINPVAWSLEVECQFYLLAPLMVSVFRIPNTSQRRALLGVLVAAAALFGQSLDPADARWQLSLARYLGYFLTGFLLTDLYLVSWKERPEKTSRWDVYSVASWLVIAALLYAPAALQVLLPIPILGAYCGAFRGRICNRLFRARAVYTIGGMCYTIYLYHGLLIFPCGDIALALPAFDGLGLSASLVLSAVLVVPPVLAACALLFVVTERPFMRRDWHLRLTARLQTGLERGA